MANATNWISVLAMASLASAQRNIASVEFEADPSRETAHFRARAGGVDLWTIDGGAVLGLRRGEREAVAVELFFGGGAPSGATPRCVVRNHFRGGHVRSADEVFAQLRFDEVRPGCDVVWREGGGGFEYDFELEPGADVGELDVRVRGHEDLWISPQGELVIETALGALVQLEPIAWYVVDGERRPVPCRFVVHDANSFGFDVDRIDPLHPLVIDPALRWSSYLSGGGEQGIHCVAVGPNETTLVGGYTDSIDFPITLGVYDPYWSGGLDGFVACFSSDGTQLLWSTFLGGALSDIVRSIQIDPNGSVVIAGETFSSDFPSTAGSFDPSFNGDRDVFVAQLSSDGAALEWSTFVGGAFADRFGQMVREPSGDVLLVGATRGSGFPTTVGAYDTTFNGGGFFGDVFVTRLAPDGASVIWSTFLGSAGEEQGERIALGPQGEIAIAGSAYSSAFPTTVGAFDRIWSSPWDLFVAVLDANGAQLVFSSLLGGSGEEYVRSVAVEANGSVLCAGETLSLDFPLTATAFDTAFDGTSEGFLSRFSSDGSALTDSTFVGGLEDDRITSIALDSNGNVVIGCETKSEGLFTTPGCYDSNANMPLGGLETAMYFARFDPTLGAPNYATYFGSTHSDALAEIVLDLNDEVVFAGTTQGPGFPVSAGAFQSSWNITATHDGFAGRLALLVHPISFGSGKVNSGGSAATVRWEGFPSLADGDFKVGVDFALPNVWCHVFSGTQTVNWPFVGHALRVRPPFKRYARFKSDFLGYGTRAIALAPWMVGQTFYFQVWYEDVNDADGAALTDALRVFVYP